MSVLKYYNMSIFIRFFLLVVVALIEDLSINTYLFYPEYYQKTIILFSYPLFLWIYFLEFNN